MNIHRLCIKTIIPYQYCNLHILLKLKDIGRKHTKVDLLFVGETGVLSLNVLHVFYI
jgi:hypothetical protein